MLHLLYCVKSFTARTRSLRAEKFLFSHVSLYVHLCGDGGGQVNTFEQVQVVGGSQDTAIGKRTVGLQLKGFLVHWIGTFVS